MSDPLDRLRGAPVPESTVDVGAIKARARKITRRREMGVSAAAVAVVLIAGIGFLRGPISDEPAQQVAQDQLASATPGGETATLAEPERAGRAATDATEDQAEKADGQTERGR